MESVISIVFIAFALYLLTGLIFYIVFWTKLSAKIDKNTKGASLGFKLLVLPGIVTLWPFLVAKMKQSSKVTNNTTNG